MVVIKRFLVVLYLFYILSKPRPEKGGVLHLLGLTRERRMCIIELRKRRRADGSELCRKRKPDKIQKLLL